MSDDTENTNDNENQNKSGNEQQNTADTVSDKSKNVKPASLDEAIGEIRYLRSALQDSINSRDKAKDKTRQAEKKVDDLESEVGTARTLVKNSSIDIAMSDALKDKVTSVPTALKLIDRSGVEFGDDGTINADSLKTVIEKLKESDSILFKAEDNTDGENDKGNQAPAARRAGEGDTGGSGYAKEIRSALTQKDIMAVMKKYGKV